MHVCMHFAIAKPIHSYINRKPFSHINGMGVKYADIFTKLLVVAFSNSERPTSK